MGCLYACTCGGRCYDCSMYQKEEYFGHAEDLLAQTKGFRDAQEWNDYERQQQKERNTDCD